MALAEKLRGFHEPSEHRVAVGHKMRLGAVGVSLGQRLDDQAQGGERLVDVGAFLLSFRDRT